MATKQPLVSDLAIPPGEYLEEVLEEKGMSKRELAQRMGRPETKLNDIYTGKKRITEDTALQLEQVLGVPASIWLGLESEYRLTLARGEERRRQEQQREAEEQIARAMPYNAMRKLSLVPQATALKDKICHLRDFFGVTSLVQVPEVTRYQPAFRQGNGGTRCPEAIAAWLRLGEKRAEAVKTAPFETDRLTECLPRLRAMTVQEPGTWVPELSTLLAGCGVALVIVPHFPKTCAHGATFRLGQKAVLMITVRGKWADVFWFSLFHEVGHVLRHLTKQRSIIIEDGEQNDQEREADEFSRDLLIPPSIFTAFRRTLSPCYISEAQVKAFAEKTGVHPGIVVGRLHHEGLLPKTHLHGLREQYELNVEGA